MRILAVLIGFLVLSGCAEYQERQNEERQMAHHSQCRSYGFEVGSTPHANCMMGIDQQETMPA